MLAKLIVQVQWEKKHQETNVYCSTKTNVAVRKIKNYDFRNNQRPGRSENRETYKHLLPSRSRPRTGFQSDEQRWW